MNLYTYILDFRGGTYCSQLTADKVENSIVEWISSLKKEVNDIQFLGMKSIEAIEAEVLNQKPTKVMGLNNTWVITFTINQSFGMVHIIKTMPLKSNKYELKLENYDELVAQAKAEINSPVDNIFKIEWLIELLEQKSEEELVKQLKEFPTKEWIKRPYIRFVSGKNANQKGAQWQFERNIILEHNSAGTIVVDVLKDGRIGGFELLDELE